jgi:hypothetical protein
MDSNLIGQVSLCKGRVGINYIWQRNSAMGSLMKNGSDLTQKRFEALD